MSCRRHTVAFLPLVFGCALFPAPAGAQLVQRGEKMAGVGASRSEAARQGSSVALSADGSAAIEGGPYDDHGRGAAWVFTRSGTGWVQQGERLAANDAVGASVFQGRSVALSADGNTAIVGGDGDNQGTGAAWVFTRADGAWTEQAKLTGSGAAGKSEQGSAVALSADGNTAIVGGMSDDNGAGAAWIFTRTGGVWTQQGAKLVGGAGAPSGPGMASQGRAAALSEDGNTALIGGSTDGSPSGVPSGISAAWIFTRSGDTWTQQGGMLVGSGVARARSRAAVYQGYGAALSGDGNTAVIGGYDGDSGAPSGPGAGWVFTRSGDAWAQQGEKLTVPAGAPTGPGAEFGFSDALSADGNRLLLGGPNDDGGAGAAWEFRRVNGAWMRVGKLVGRGASGKAQQGYAVALSGDGHTAILGGIFDPTSGGAVWTFGDPTLAIAAPASATAGAPVAFTVTAQDAGGNTDMRYSGTVHFTSSDGQAVLPADAALTEGVGSISVTFKTSGTQTIAAADTFISSIAATSGPVPVSAGPATRFLVEAPASAATGQNVLVSFVPVDQFNNQAEYTGAVQVTSSDPRAVLPGVIRFSRIPPAALRGTLTGAGPVADSGNITVKFLTAGKQNLTVSGSGGASPSGSGPIILTQDQAPTDYISVVLASNPFAYFRLQAANDTSVVNGYTSTFKNGATLATTGAPICEPNNYSVSLDGTSGWVSTTLSGGIATAGSLAAWVNLATLPTSAANFLYVAGESQNGNDFDLQFTNDGFIRFYISHDSINVGYQPNPSTLVNQWHMIVATFDSSTNTENLYWDGQPVASANNTVFTNKTAPFTMGQSDVFTGRYFAGGLDEVALWTYALTANQVSSLFASASCPALPPDNETIHVTDSFTLLPSVMLSDNETITVTDTEGLALTQEFTLHLGITISPAEILAGPDGAIWFTEQADSKIGRIAVGGVLSEYPTLTPSANPTSIASGPDGAIWFTEQSANKIGRITLAGMVTEFMIPTANSVPMGIAAGPDGAMWFTESMANKIGRISTAGVINEFGLPSGHMDPEQIALGPDGNLYLTEPANNMIAVIGSIAATQPFLSGMLMINGFAVPTANSLPKGIVAGPDGNVWFTESMGNQIGRLALGGAGTMPIMEYQIPTPNSTPQMIASGPDGALWFTENSASKIGRITTDPTVVDFPTPTTSAGPLGIAPGPNGALWFTENSASQIGEFATAVTATPALSIQSSHSGNFTPGEQGATYTLTVADSTGAGSTAGVVTAMETLPAGLTLVSMSGTGWTCPSPNGVPSGMCTRNDPLAGGSPYPAITVMVNVAAGASSPQVNTASVFGGGSALAVTTDSTFIGATVLLSIASSHTGNFAQGQQGTYTVTVSNVAGSASTSGTVTVTETVPPGMTLASMAGTGWSCPSGSNSCTRTDPLAGGGTYAAITVTVNVAANATSPQVNGVSVSGGGSASASAADSTIIGGPPVLSIAKSHTGNFSGGQQGATYTVAVSNAASSGDTSGTVTVTETVPAGLTLVSMAGTGWNCPSGSNSCTRNDPLQGGGTYAAITVTVNVAANATSPQVNSVSVSGGGSSGTAMASDSTVINATVSITITTNPAGLSIVVDTATLTAPQTFQWVAGTQHSIGVTTPQGASGTSYVFNAWGNGGAQTQNITVPAVATTYTADFTTQYLLTTQASPAAGGTVSPATGGYYNAGTSVPITATAASGFQFANWSDSVASASSASTSVTMTAPETVIANFSSLTGITIQTNPPGLQFTVDSGVPQTAPQSLSLPPGTHTITVATTQAGSGGTGTQDVFASWSDGGAASHNIAVGASAATYTATFTTQYLLTTAVSPAGTGGVTASPASSYYNAGSSVQLTASPNAGYRFSNWSGGLSGSTNPQSIAMSASESVTANFTAPCTIALSPASTLLPSTGTATVEVCPNNSGQPICGVYPENPQSFTVTPSAVCGPWTATSSSPGFLQVLSGPGSGVGTVTFAQLTNTHNGQQSNTITVTSGAASATYTVMEAGNPDSQTYREIYALYQQFLGRDPDAGGLAFWSGAGGAGLGQMADDFLTSPEYFNSGFAVMAVYQAATGSGPTYAQYTAAVASIRAGAQTVPGLFNALIGASYTSTTLYQNLLNRAPVTADSGCIGTGVAQCFQTIIGYPANTTPVSAPNNEFQSTGTYHTTLAADHTNALYVQMIYFVTLDRDPDPSGYSFWVGIANQGGPGLLFQGAAGYFYRDQILGPGTPNQGFIGSPEFQGLFAN